jgi:hypothetical protein
MRPISAFSMGITPMFLLEPFLALDTAMGKSKSIKVPRLGPKVGSEFRKHDAQNQTFRTLLGSSDA